MHRRFELLLLLLVARTLAACSCAGGFEFLDVARRALVIRGVVESYVNIEGRPFPVAMNVAIRDVMTGSYAPGTIRIIGDFGMSCVPYVSNFPIGTEWVFAVGGPVEVDGLGDENFSFPPCAGAWMMVLDGKANGGLSMGMGQHEIELSVLKELIANPDAQPNLQPMFASVRSSKEKDVIAPGVTGDQQLHLASSCLLESLNVEVVVGAQGNLLHYVPDRKVELCASNALYSLLHRWHFTPATQNGKPIAIRHSVPIKVAHDAPGGQH